MRQIGLALFLASTIACGGGSGAGPSPTPNPTPPPPTHVDLTGTVVDLASKPIAGATIKALDGADAGRSTVTDGGGNYTLTQMTANNVNLSCTAPTYAEERFGLNLSVSHVVNWKLKTAQPWHVQGIGDNVFDMPTYITRVAITGDYNKNSSNFIVRIGGHLIVNELVGTFWNQTHFAGTYTTSGGVVEITNSSGVTWGFTEVR